MEVENEINNITTKISVGQPIVFSGLGDWKIIIYLSITNMEAYADFIPVFSSGRLLEMGEVRTVLARANIIYGINWDLIAEIVDECISSRYPIKDVLIAKGDPAETEITEYYEFNRRLFDKNEDPVDDKTVINYKERSPFTIVKKGQILARLKPRKPGKDGTNVRGETVPFDVISPEGVSGGANTRTENGLIVADIYGQLINTKRELSVQEYLVIKGAVGYRTGNIVFPGDVTINGPVMDGFKIYTGGSLVIKQALDCTDIVTKGNISVAGGIIGRDQGIIKCGGSIRTKFIQSCQVAARKSIFVEAEIIYSNVYTLESIYMGDRGIILGGDIYAVQGIKAGKIGKKGSPAVRIHCGIDFSAQQEIEKCSNRMSILSAKLTKLQEWIDNPVSDTEIQTKMVELYHKLEKEQQNSAVRIGELLGKININPKATVEVMDEIVPGTLIEICQAALFIEKPLRNVRIRMEPSNGKVITESL